MKTINKLPFKVVIKFIFLTVLSLSISCSSDKLLEADEDLVNKSKNSILKTLVKGASIQGANGIEVGPDGNLYIASVNGQEIVVMDKNSGKIINRFGPESGVLGPDDLVFGPDGTLYWTDLLTGFVGRMTIDGQILGYQEVAPGVNPITFSPDGRLFVALDFLGDGLYELDPNLIDPPRVIIEASEGNPFPLGFFNSFDFGEDGLLYGPLFAAGLVIAVDVGEAGDPVSTSPFADGIAQVIAGGFENPAATKFGPDGLLYVLDQTGEVFKINTSTGSTNLFTTLDPGLDNLDFDTDGTLYMTNADEGWVAEILKNGKARIISTGGIIFPQGLAVVKGPNNQDVVYEADLFRLLQFNGTSGQQENNYKGYLIPQGPESLILPMNLSADGDNLVISSWFSEGVQVWNPQDGVIENYPDVVVPIDAVETLWAADWATGDIWQIEFDGASPVVVASGLVNPEGLALDKEGRLLVVEAGASRLSRVDLNSGEVTILVEDLELFGPGLGAPPTWAFDGVAIGPSGNVYISGAGANVIYRISGNKLK